MLKDKSVNRRSRLINKCDGEYTSAAQANAQAG